MTTDAEHRRAATTPPLPGSRRHLPAVAGFASLTAAFFWPILRHFPTQVLSAGGDGSTFLWSYWFMPRSVFRGENPFTTTHLFHPVGANLAFQTTTPFEMAISWPIAELFGVGIAVNVLQLCAVVLSAVGAYFLALRACQDQRAAFFAGAAFAFVPYRFIHVEGHFNLIHAEFLPFGLIALLRLMDEPSRPRATVLGLVVGLTFLTDYYYAVFLLLAIAVVLAVYRKKGLSNCLGRRLVQAGFVAALMASPLLIATTTAVAAGELDALPGWGGADLYSADLLSWFVPPERHPWWGWTSSKTGEGLAYPGLLVIGLAVAGRELGARAERKPWVILASVAGVLSLGPFLQVGRATGALFSYMESHFALPLPFFAVHLVPVLNGVRVPGRFAILAILALDILAAVTLAGLARHRPRWAWPIALAALAVTLVEFLRGPLATHPIAVPAPYHRIAADPDPGAVLEIPLQWELGFAVVGDTERARNNTIFLYYATVHEKPVVSGSISRYPRDRLERLISIPVYRQLLALAGEPGFLDPPTFGARDLQDLGIGFVAYHRDRPQPEVLAHLEGLDLDVLADDGTIVVWKVRA